MLTSPWSNFSLGSVAVLLTKAPLVSIIAKATTTNITGSKIFPLTILVYNILIASLVVMQFFPLPISNLLTSIFFDHPAGTSVGVGVGADVGVGPEVGVGVGVEVGPGVAVGPVVGVGP